MIHEILVLYQALLMCLLVFDAYKKIAGCDIEESIKDECTGNLEGILLAVGKRKLKPPATYTTHVNRPLLKPVRHGPCYKFSVTSRT